ncbi:hypothetical protein PILCRDRAFT_573970 [Piloderma croceum F 1598]|uniref:Uncharacterized protein n=1 Tax=Piloderma croceum (strain F 1598) TaxID=765440 RepID=A0A0C3AYD3_PILCF|nr:hypothetical protein PILCRDRAFT_573970 [Piloderma croceum F 1598]
MNAVFQKYDTSRFHIGCCSVRCDICVPGQRSADIRLIVRACIFDIATNVFAKNNTRPQSEPVKVVFMSASCEVWLDLASTCEPIPHPVR